MSSPAYLFDKASGSTQRQVVLYTPEGCDPSRAEDTVLTFQAIHRGPRGGVTIMPLGLSIAELEEVLRKAKEEASRRQGGAGAVINGRCRGAATCAAACRDLPGCQNKAVEGQHRGE